MLHEQPGAGWRFEEKPSRSSVLLRHSPRSRQPPCLTVAPAPSMQVMRPPPSTSILGRAPAPGEEWATPRSAAACGRAAAAWGKAASGEAKGGSARVLPAGSTHPLLAKWLRRALLPPAPGARPRAAPARAWLRPRVVSSPALPRARAFASPGLLWLALPDLLLLGGGPEDARHPPHPVHPSILFTWASASLRRCSNSTASSAFR